MAGKHGGRRSGSGRKPTRPISGGWVLYLVREVDDSTVHKIGITGDLYFRFAALQSAQWRTLEVAKAIPVNGAREARKLEAFIHAKLSSRRIRGEWFRVGLDEALTTIGESMVEAAERSQDQLAFFK